MNKQFQKIYLDPYLFFSIFLISSLGLFFLFSASNGDIGSVIKQLVYVIIGLALMVSTWLVKATSVAVDSRL